MLKRSKNKKFFHQGFKSKQSGLKVSYGGLKLKTQL